MSMFDPTYGELVSQNRDLESRVRELEAALERSKADRDDLRRQIALAAQHGLLFLGTGSLP